MSFVVKGSFGEIEVDCIRNTIIINFFVYYVLYKT